MRAIRNVNKLQNGIQLHFLEVFPPIPLSLLKAYPFKLMRKLIVYLVMKPIVAQITIVEMVILTEVIIMSITIHLEIIATI